MHQTLDRADALKLESADIDELLGINNTVLRADNVDGAVDALQLPLDLSRNVFFRAVRCAVR